MMDPMNLFDFLLRAPARNAGQACALVTLLLAGCATHDRKSGSPELLPDPTFAQWFDLNGLGQPDDDGQVKGVFRSSEARVGSPVWTLAQWSSAYSFADAAVTRQTQLGKNRFQIANPSKRVTVDSRRGEIELGLFASACYAQPRQKNESWPHLLVSTALTDTRYASERCRVSGLSRLDVSMECRLTAFEDRHPGADPDLHAAQFQLFLYVQNLNLDSPGYGDMLWFGVPVFDNRRPASEERYQRDGGKADASGKFIYTLPTRSCQPRGNAFFKDGRVAADPDGRWTEIRVNAAPWIVYAYQLARKNGYLKDTELADLYVSGLNFGWEMPGTYDASMQVRGFSIRRQAK